MGSAECGWSSGSAQSREWGLQRPGNQVSWLPASWEASGDWPGAQQTPSDFGQDGAWGPCTQGTSRRGQEGYIGRAWHLPNPEGVPWLWGSISLFGT